MIKQEQGYTRKAFFEDAVRVYIKNNQKEFASFKKIAKQRKDELVSDHAELKKIVNGKMRADEDHFRLAISMPEKLFNTLYTILKTDGENSDGLFESKKEMYWFMRKFPEFTIPKKV